MLAMGASKRHVQQCGNWCVQHATGLESPVPAQGVYHLDMECLPPQVTRDEQKQRNALMYGNGLSEDYAGPEPGSACYVNKALWKSFKAMLAYRTQWRW